MAGDDIVDAEWEEVPGNDGKVEIYRPRPQAQEPPREPHKAAAAEHSPWLDTGFWQQLATAGGKLVVHTLLLAGAFMGVLIGIAAWLGFGTPAQIDSPVAAQQILSDWAQFVTGVASTDGFTLIDGEGEAGEFCSSATGASMMNFGNQVVDNAQIYDFFSWLPESDSTVIAGAFQFDAEKGQLLLTQLIKGDLQTDKHRSIENIRMRVSRAAPGVVEIDGTRYHVCATPAEGDVPESAPQGELQSSGLSKPAIVTPPLAGDIWRNGVDIAGQCQVILDDKKVMDGPCSGMGRGGSLFITDQASGCSVELNRLQSNVSGTLLAYKDICWLDENARLQVESDIALGNFRNSAGCWVNGQARICLDVAH